MQFREQFSVSITMGEGRIKPSGIIFVFLIKQAITVACEESQNELKLEAEVLKTNPCSLDISLLREERAFLQSKKNNS